MCFFGFAVLVCGRVWQGLGRFRNFLRYSFLLENFLVILVYFLRVGFWGQFLFVKFRLWKFVFLRVGWEFGVIFCYYCFYILFIQRFFLAFRFQIFYRRKQLWIGFFKKKQCFVGRGGGKIQILKGKDIDEMVGFLRCGIVGFYVVRFFVGFDE